MKEKKRHNYSHLSITKKNKKQFESNCAKSKEIKKIYKIKKYYLFFGCSIYKKIPPATETLSDSYSPVIAMLTSSHACRDFSERPLPSLPKTKHNGVSNMESQKLGEREKTGLINPSCCGCPATNFIWNSSLRDSKWFQLPETIGSWKDAPRLARSAFSLNGSQHPGSRKTPSCWQNKLIPSCFLITIEINYKDI